MAARKRGKNYAGTRATAWSQHSGSVVMHAAHRDNHFVQPPRPRRLQSTPDVHESIETWS